MASAVDDLIFTAFDYLLKTHMNILILEKR